MEIDVITKIRTFLMRLNIRWGSKGEVQARPLDKPPSKSELEVESEPESQ